jgi:hypothetical protein
MVHPTSARRLSWGFLRALTALLLALTAAFPAAAAIHVRVSPPYLTAGVALPVIVSVFDQTGAAVPGALVRLTSVADASLPFGTGTTSVTGKAILGPVKVTAAEIPAGVRVSVTSSAGFSDDTILAVRTAVTTFTVEEIRLVDPPENSRISVTEGEPLIVSAVARGIGTGPVSGWWEVDGIPVMPFTARMLLGSSSGLPITNDPKATGTPDRLSPALRLGPNSIRLVITTPNRLESRYLVVDVGPKPEPAVMNADGSAIMLADAAGASASSPKLPEVSPGKGPHRKGVKLGVKTSTAAVVSMRLTSSTDGARYRTAVPPSAADVSFTTSADLSLEGDVTSGATFDARTHLAATRDSLTMGDLNTRLGMGGIDLGAGRAALRGYGRYTISGMAARQVLRVSPPGKKPRWEVFGLRTDSGISGGFGGEGRFDRYAFGGRYGFHLGTADLELAAAHVNDTGSPAGVPGTFAASQASTAVALSLKAPIRWHDDLASAAASIAWSRYDPDRDASTGLAHALAYDLQLSGQRSRVNWSAQLFNVPMDFCTLGNPSLRRGARGWTASLVTPASPSVDLSLSFSDRREEFLAGGFDPIPAVPGSKVRDFSAAATLNTGDGLFGTLSGTWGSRSNDAADTNRLDQAERTVALTLTKDWHARTLATLTFSTYDLSDRAHAISSLRSRQTSFTVSQALGSSHFLQLTWSRFSTDLGPGPSILSTLLGLDLDGPLFSDRLRCSLGYMRSNNSDNLGQYDTTLQEYRFRLRYRPKRADTLWMRFLSSLSLEARMIRESDPALGAMGDHHFEVWLAGKPVF